jgi:hypothetical protein
MGSTLKERDLEKRTLIEKIKVDACGIEGQTDAPKGA